jgi:hypothetical protein
MDIALKTLKSDKMPRHYAVVHRDGNLWWLERWEYAYGVHKRRSEAYGRGPDSLWAELVKACPKGRTEWVFCWEAYAALCWLGLYDRVNAEQCTLPGARPQLTDGQRTGGKAGPWGYFVCDSSPTIVDLDLPSAGRLRWVDIDNYGLEPKHLLAEGERHTIASARIAVQGYYDMVVRYGMGSLKPTAASQGFARFRRHDLTERLIPTQDPEVRKLERAAYFGGRCEAFRIGRLPGKVYHLDYTSFYSAIGHDANFPILNVERVDSPSVDHLRCYEQKLLKMADVDVRTVENCYPLRLNGKVIFPVGEFRTTLCGGELVYALEAGSVTKVHAAAWYNAGSVWKKFAEWYLAARADLGNSDLAYMAPALKAIGNGAYGKIGARGVQWSATDFPHRKMDWGQWYGEHPVHGDLTLYRAIHGQVSYRDQSYEPPNTFPAIAAFHTSTGRLLLSIAMLIADPNNVYYVDTDSLMVSQEGYDILREEGFVADATPGRLSVREVSDDVEVFGIKHYRFGARVCCAGVEYEPAEAAARRDEVERTESFNSSLKRGEPFSGRVDVIGRSRTAPYSHGHVCRDGVVAPWIVGFSSIGVIDDRGNTRAERGQAVLGYYRVPAAKPAADGDLPTVHTGGSDRSDANTMSP